MLGRMNTAQQAQRSVAVGSMPDITALVGVWVSRSSAEGSW